MVSSYAGITGTEDIGKNTRERPAHMEEAGEQDGQYIDDINKPQEST